MGTPLVPRPTLRGMPAHDWLRIRQTLFSSISFPVKIIPARPGRALNLPSLRISANDRETGRGEVYGTRRRALQTVRAVQPGERGRFRLRFPRVSAVQHFPLM